jgi:hypothetical protein
MQTLDPARADLASRLDSRYGRRPGRTRRSRLIALVAGGAVALVVAAWVVLVAFDGDSAELEVSHYGFTVAGDDAVRVQYTINVTGGTDVACAVQALNENRAVVGWKVVDLPAVDTFTQTYATSLVTSERAVTGSAYRCWVR